MLEEFPLIDGGRRAYAEAFAMVQEDDLVGVFGSQV